MKLCFIRIAFNISELVVGSFLIFIPFDELTIPFVADTKEIGNNNSTIIIAFINFIVTHPLILMILKWYIVVTNHYIIHLLNKNFKYLI